MKNGDQPAFANNVYPELGGDIKDNFEGLGVNPTGLTKREMIAAMAMSGILSNPSCIPTEQVHFLNICEDAIRATDQLLKQLETK